MEATATGTPVDDLIVRLPEGEAERKLLLAAGAAQVYLQAGKTAQSGGALPDRAADERLPVCSRQAAQLIESLLRGQHADLLPEALERLAQSGRRLPPTLLPAALSVGQAEGRSAMVAVLGERGRWLSRFNPQWRWVEGALVETPDASLEDAERLWQEGTPGQRRGALRRVRMEHPDMARAWIAAVWRQEKADFRVELLNVLEGGLSPEDEPFLEATLDDRSANVRARAAELLARLPGSSLLARMRERADILLDYSPAPPQRLKTLMRSVFGGAEQGGTLAVRPPDQLDKAAQRDGIVPKPPEGLGERAWWLTQLLAIVPPAHWERRFAAQPAQLVAAAARDEWSMAVIEGWSRAAVLHRASDWALALWERWYAVDQTTTYYPRVATSMLGSLVALLPHTAAAEIVRRPLNEGKDVQPHTWQLILSSIPRPWSAELAQAYVETLKNQVRTDRFGADQASISWWCVPDVAARALPPRYLREVQGLWTEEELRDRNWLLRRFVETLHIREQIWKEIPV
jgi:hypothetical protein